MIYLKGVGIWFACYASLSVLSIFISGQEPNAKLFGVLSAIGMGIYITIMKAKKANLKPGP